jgi:Fe-S-cluster-containing hydrogenase component 2
MLIPGVEIPHLCTQCTDYPCVYSCPYEALSIESETSAVLVDKEKCVTCGICIDACPGKIPHIHPRKNHVLICDLCKGDPQCVKVCRNAGYHCLNISREKSSISQNLFARTPEELTRDVSENLYGERALELL